MAHTRISYPSISYPHNTVCRCQYGLHGCLKCVTCPAYARCQSMQPTVSSHVMGDCAAPFVLHAILDSIKCELTVVSCVCSFIVLTG